ncbi:MAG TPA: aspartate--tRNA ligase [Candidatus Limnocylindrales bacterium]|jgi:aspartyl-tRNA synthetase|nr:aspartate--tRNA ligase [Candidatus Limnocylindrales bacterium]
MTDQDTDLATPYRTRTAGALRASDAGTSARLAGWVHRRRDHGQLIFLDVRDRHGLTQVVIDRAEAPTAHEVASRVRPEFVVTVAGEVARRLAGTENPRLATGDIELRANDIDILSEAKTPPFYINEPDAPVDESLRLKYRYLDIRRQPMAERLMLRSRMVQAIREVHHANGFLEVETPTLIKSTPEGARDFIVPSRLQPGSVYALPQSPQQLKQLLMVGGVDRYFQIARCYRDEDLRGDRQPEFTQLDLEMSFVDEELVMGFVERMAIEVSRATTPDRPIQTVPFPRFTFDEAIERYGSDKPDVRFGMELVDLAPTLVDPAGQPASGFRVFDETLAAGGRVKAIVAPGMAGVTRREIDGLTERARRFGAKGLAYLALEPGGEVKSPIAKFLGDDTQRAIVERTGAAEGDLILIVADTPAVTADVLGRLRVEIGDRLGLADPDALAYVWVNRFPMYQWDDENGRWDATHNPFSGVLPEDEALLVTASGDPDRPSPDDPAGRARALQYDLALNGWELGGGSVRIHRRDLLERSFRLQGQSMHGMREKFGAILDAFEYGAPPHGGIALGIDRWAALLARQTNIREVMAFPKTQSGSDLMLEAPSEPEPKQYDELGLRFVGLPSKAPD